jgi:hypothetical protein
MTQRLQLIGKTFGQLTVLRFAQILRQKSTWWCLCKCGKRLVVRGDALVTGNTTTCGCSANEIGEKANAFKHGHSYGKRQKPTSEYNSWLAMKARCYDLKNNRYNNYGGRGIRVCTRWLNSFTNFLADMGEKPEPKQSYSIDRYPNKNGNYEPSNCRWATDSQQMRNRRPFSRKHKRAVAVDSKTQTRRAE